MPAITKAGLKKAVDRALRKTPITDIHTHLYTPSFGDLLLRGIDELLTYHYLVAESFHWLEMPFEDFWKLSKREQADLIWKTLFVEHSPYSEACRGVLTVLNKWGLDVRKRNLDSYRKFFAKLKVEKHVDQVFKLANVREVVMTNDPFDASEHDVWMSGYRSDERFRAALRIDTLLIHWDVARGRLKEWGYDVEETLSARTVEEVGRFLREWSARMRALYTAVSLTPDFDFPNETFTSRMLDRCVIPVMRELDMPLALMIGVKRQTNPELRLAGDSVGLSSVTAVERLCARHPKNKFMVTMLARENQHELCVAARKFRNLLLFGCWWFINNPSLIKETTRMRFELLGPGVVPQHSDARVLDQIVYKWEHSRKVIGEVLVEKYTDLLNTGWTLTEKELSRDVAELLGGNFWTFLDRRL